MAIPNILDILFRPTPALKLRLKQAHMSIEPKKFIRQNLTLSAYLAVGATIILSLIIQKQSGKLSILPFLLMPVIFILANTFFMGSIVYVIRQREKEINKNIVFATRYIIIKMESGQPLLNSLVAASRGYGVGGKFFREIADDVSLGKPIEQALEDAHKNNPSHMFQLVLRQILNALRTGIDVSDSLKKILEQITREQQIEIKEYSKKLNSLVLFYLLAACVLPSLGISMFLVIGSLTNLTFDFKTYLLILVFMFMLQLFFLGVVSSIKPTVEI
jgi:pilus assembly protein TadC